MAARQGVLEIMGATGVDVRGLQDGFKAHKRRGIGVYIRSLIGSGGLAASGLDARYFHDAAYEDAEPRSLGSMAIGGGAAPIVKRLMKEYAWIHFGFWRYAAPQLGRAGVNLAFFPTHLDVPIGVGMPYVTTAHDMIQAVLQKKFYVSWKHKVDIARQKEALRGARLVIAVSRHTKEDVVRIAGVDPDRVMVIHNGIDPGFGSDTGAGLEKFDLPGKFILHVGGIDWRKNIVLLLDSFKRLADEAADYHLVVAGQIENDPRYPSFVKMIGERGLDGRVHMPGFVTRRELAALYAKAHVFVYPSLYEGFGYPVLEAMACGAPVVTTNVSSIPEVAGDAAATADPEDAKAFSETLVRVAESCEERERLSRAGIRRAAMFSWEDCGKQTGAALASASQMAKG